MKKAISLLLAGVLTLTTGVMAFAETKNGSDVKGTPYETAVTDLMEKGYLSGYGDGTFRPENTISRAEASSILIHIFKASATELSAAKDSGFTDMETHKWAKPAVNYAVQKEMTKGYSDGTFRPGNKVTYAEIAAMIVNAKGLKDQVKGTWPSNYMNQAEKLGYFKGTVSVSTTGSANVEATRGNVALMMYNAIASKEEKPEVPTPPITTLPALSDFSGYAFGAVNEYAKTLNAEGSAVTEIEFIFGNKVQYPQTKKTYTPQEPIAYDGTLYCLRVESGKVTLVATHGAINTGKISPKKFEEMTVDYEEVTKVENNRVVFTRKTDGTTRVMELNDDKLAVFVSVQNGKDTTNWTVGNGYRPGKYSDISKGDKIRVYDVSKDGDYGDVVFVQNK